MIASKIKEGVHYAVRSDPRKGVEDDRLHTLTAFRVIVQAKNCQRFAENATDQWGCPNGAYRMDGIRALRVVDATGERDSVNFGENVWKARDFLMPWSEYEARRKADADAEKAKRDAERALHLEWENKRIEMRRRLNEFGLLDGYSYVRPVEPDSEQRDFVEYDNTGADTIMYGISHKGLEKLLSSIADKVYEIASAME